MNKKGFTLIELLAIIVILAVIAVITVPIILNIIDDAEKSSSIDSAHGYKDALQKYYATKSIQNTELELPNGYYEISELPSDFIVSGELPSKGWVKLKKGIVERFSLKYKDYVVSMDNDKNIFSEKQENVEPHVTNDYQEVEYLESTGTQYIDTGYTPKQNDYLELKHVTRKSDGALFSAGTGDYQFIFLSQVSNNYFKFFSTGAASYFVLGNYNNSNIKVYNNNLYINDQLLSTCEYGGDVNTDLRLFARKGNTSYISAQIGNVIIKNDNVLVRNLVPVIRKSDNKPGMLDLANYSNNLIPEIVQGGVNYSSGILSSSSNRVRTNKISVEPGKTYTINSNILYISTIVIYSDNTYYSTIDSGTNQNTKTFTIPEDANQVAIGFKNADGTNINASQDWEIMLNEGTTALTYETYGYKFHTNAGEGEFIAGPEI